MKKQLFTIAFAVLSLALFAAQPIKVGEKAPSFSLKGVDGKTVSLSDYSNEKGVILIFTCNTCPVVVANEDRIIALHNKFAAKGFPVVAINSNDPGVSAGDSFDNMKVRAEEKSFPFPYLFDEQQAVLPTYGATRTPEVFLLKNKGDEFVVAYTGAIDDNANNADDVEEKFLDNAINAVLAGNSPNLAVTKAVGCGIKVKK